MKERSINQINSRIQKNQVINLYKKLSKWDISRDDWRNQRYSFTGRRGKREITGNYIFAAALRELFLIRGLNTDYPIRDYHRDNRRVFFEIKNYQNKIQFDCSTKIDLNGVYIQIETNFAAMPRHSTYMVRSNKIFQELNIENYVREKILPKYLYPAGTFRNIQLLLNYTKADALDAYEAHQNRTREKIKKQKEDPRIFEAEGWELLLKKKRNIITDGWLSVAEMKQLYYSTEWNKKQQKAVKGPNTMQLFDEFTSLYDDDEMLIPFVEEALNDYPDGTILV